MSLGMSTDRSPHVNGALILEHQGPAEPGDVCILEMMMVRACYSHSENNFCVVGCQTALWYSTTRIAQHPLDNAQCSEPVADVTLF